MSGRRTMKHCLADLLAHHWCMSYLWWAYPRRLRLWLFLNADLGK